MLVVEKDVYLAHQGVKGMKWGVRKARRKTRLTRSEHYDKDFVHNADVYRVLAKSGSRKLKDIAYVSTNDVDNNRYIHILNHTISARLFKDSRYDKQLILGPSVPLKAPSLKKAETEMQKLHDTSPVLQKFVKDNELYFGKDVKPADLNKIVNTAMVDNDVLFDGSSQMRKEVKTHFQKQGYNSLLDMNDISEGLAKSPLIVFDPETTLRVVSQHKIDDVMKRAATKKYIETNKRDYV